MQRTNNDVLMIAARKPVAGETKTRLGNAIGHHHAAAIYRAFLTDLAHRFQAAPLPYDVVWAHTPESSPFAEVIQDLLPEYPGTILCVEQQGDTWFSRQDRLMRWAAEAGYERTLLTASDSPQMSRAMITAGFNALESSPITLGRVHDGGYYLVGMAGYFDILNHVPMSTRDTSDILISVANAAGLRVTEISPTFDIDLVDDLEQLFAALADDPLIAPATHKALNHWRAVARAQENQGNTHYG